MTESERPTWFKICRKFKILTNPEHHKLHHIAATSGKGTLVSNYSLHLGKVDGILDLIMFYEFVELVMYLVFNQVALEPRLGKYMYLDGKMSFKAKISGIFWNLFYAGFSIYFKSSGLTINSMNWGYHCGDEENKQHKGDHLVLTKQQVKQVLPDCSMWETEKFSLQLYRKNVSAVKGGLAGKDIADVSCGKGGGIRMLAELGAVGDKKRPASVVGMDYSPVSVDDCNRNYPMDRRPDNLTFVHGSAEAMPFADNSKDVIISTEASHCYPSKLKFLKEAKRCLKPGGRLCIVDFMRVHQYEDYKRFIIEAGLELETDESVLKEVIRASRTVSAHKVELIEKKMPRFLWSLSKRFANTADSVTFQKFTSGVYDYRWFVIKDPSC